MAEVGLPGPGGHDQAVVRNLDGVRVGPVGLDDPVLQVDVADVSQLDGDVLVAMQHLTEGCGDLALGEDPGGHLVEQRLEQVMVATVDEDDVDFGVPEYPRRRQAAEAPTDDDDPVPAWARAAL